MNVRKMTDLALAGKRVLIREDLNVPVKQGRVTSDARIRGRRMETRAHGSEREQSTNRVRTVAIGRPAPRVSAHA